MSFLGKALGFLGGKNANKSALRAQEGAIKDSLTAFDDSYSKGSALYDEAIGGFAPYEKTGLDANKKLAYYLGLDGADGGYKKVLHDAGNGAVDPEYGQLTRRFSMNDYQEDPGYKFRLSQGEKALDRVNAKKGGYFSGKAITDALGLNSNLASQEYGAAYNRYNQDMNNIFNRLFGVSGTGFNATSNKANLLTGKAGFDTQYAANKANLLTARGDAKANYRVGNANLTNQFLADPLGLDSGGGRASSFSSIAKFL